MHLKTQECVRVVGQALLNGDLEMGTPENRHNVSLTRTVINGDIRWAIRDATGYVIDVGFTIRVLLVSEDFVITPKKGTGETVIKFPGYQHQLVIDKLQTV